VTASLYRVRSEVAIKGCPGGRRGFCHPRRPPGRATPLAVEKMLEAIKAAAIRSNIDIGSDNPGWRAGADTREGVGPAVPRDMVKAAFGGLCLIRD